MGQFSRLYHLLGLLPETHFEQIVVAETSDATSGIPAWQTVIDRINSGWQRLDPKIDMSGWQWDEGDAVWKGPRDMV